GGPRHRTGAATGAAAEAGRGRRCNGRYAVIKRLLPSPVLSAGPFLACLLLNRSADSATILLGALLAIVLPRLTTRLRPVPVRVRRPITALRLLVRVIYDSLMSNVAVARAVLTKPVDDIPSKFVRIPLDVRDPNALAVLSMIVCATPGTAWA